MYNDPELEQQLTALLSEAATKLNLQRYTVNLNFNVNRDDGSLSEMYKVSITDDETDNKIDLVVKKAPKGLTSRRNNCIEHVYKNEIYFYSTIVPTFRKFEEEQQVSYYFNAIPEFLSSSGKIEEEIVVLRDITSEGFVLRPRDSLLDEDHAKFVFETYGHFHAISFCLKDQKPEEFEELTKPLCDTYKELCTKIGFCNVMKKIMETSFETLEPDDCVIRTKFQKYVDRTIEIFLDSLDYQGQCSGILHGDCWSNNIMFKYKDNELDDIKLLDFQLVRVGTPVHDLSYCYYTGGSKKLFDQLEHYLDIYYASFSKWVKELGSVPEKIFPREVLRDDWKKYAKFGMMLALILCKSKLRMKNTVTGYDKDLFKNRVYDILSHMCEIDAL